MTPIGGWVLLCLQLGSMILLRSTGALLAMRLLPAAPRDPSLLRTTGQETS